MRCIRELIGLVTLLVLTTVGCNTASRYQGPFVSPDSQTIVCTRIWQEEMKSPIPASGYYDAVAREIRWCSVADPSHVRTHLNKTPKSRTDPGRTGLSFSPDSRRLLLAGQPAEILDLATGKVQKIDLGKPGEHVCPESITWLNDEELIYARAWTSYDGPMELDRASIYRQRMDEPTGRLVEGIRQLRAGIDRGWLATYISPNGRWLCRSLGNASDQVVQIDNPGPVHKYTWGRAIGRLPGGAPWRPDGSVFAEVRGVEQPDESVRWSIVLEPVPDGSGRQIKIPISGPKSLLHQWTAEGKYLLVTDAGCNRLVVPETGEQILLDGRLDHLLGEPKPGWSRGVAASPVPGWLIVFDRQEKRDWLGRQYCYSWRTAVDYEMTRWAMLSGTLTSDGRYEVSDPDEKGNITVWASGLSKATIAKRPAVRER